MKKNIIYTILVLSLLINISAKAVEHSVDQDIREMRGDIMNARKDSMEKRQELRKERYENVKEIRGDLRSRIASTTVSSTTATEIRKMREESKAEIMKVRQEFKSSLKANRASTTEIIREKRDGIIKATQDKREIFKKELDVRKEENKSKREELRVKYQEDLSKIKDENKKNRITNITNNLFDINTRLTTQAIERVDRIENVLLAIESRSDKINNDVNVNAVRSAITDAETAISLARVAIVNQTAKTYVVNVENENNVKNSAQTVRNSLKSDIKVMNDKIRASRDAVKKAAQTLKSVMPKDDVSTSTDTTTQ